MTHLSLKVNRRHPIFISAYYSFIDEQYTVKNSDFYHQNPNFGEFSPAARSTDRNTSLTKVKELSQTAKTLIKSITRNSIVLFPCGFRGNHSFLLFYPFHQKSPLTPSPPSGKPSNFPNFPLHISSWTLPDYRSIFYFS